MDFTSLSGFGLLLIIFGFVLAFVAMVIMAARWHSSGSGHGAGLLLIGPIPIVFGTDKQSVKWVLILAIILILLVLAIMLLPMMVGR